MSIQHLATDLKLLQHLSSVNIDSNEVMKPDVMKPEFGLLEVTKRLCVALAGCHSIHLLALVARGPF